MVSSRVDRYGVMGYPVSHSRSPVIHRLFALQTRQNLQYELLQVAPERLEDSIRQFEMTGGKGLNITVPHKNEVTRFVDELSERASSAGAVNTLTFRQGRVYGDNTDGVGLVRDLMIHLKLTLAGANILVLGAGGATRGIIAPLLEARPSSITIANRTLSKARDLADHFSAFGPVSACRFKDVSNRVFYHLVINATSAGLLGETPLNVDGALDGLNDAGKLGQKPVAHEFHDASLALRDSRLHQLSTEGL